MQNNLDRISALDQVALLTTKNVKYLSAPPNTVVTPEGSWSVAAILDGNELLLNKNNITIRIPINDIVKLKDHNQALNSIVSILEK